MEIIVANVSGKVRSDKLYGREYFVAPATLIMPGVLNGNKGPVLYTEEEVENSAPDWNFIPITVDHPRLNGKPTSAKNPKVLNSSSIGLVLNSNGRGKLFAEAWFDKEVTKRVENRIYDMLERGESFELSTGLNPFLEKASEGAVFNGEKYDYIAKSLKPDHLAVFVDKIGACSREMGCGVVVNEENVADSLFKRFKEFFSLTGMSNKEIQKEGNPSLTINEESGMKLNETEKKTIVDGLITNCGCQGPKPWVEADRQTLNGFSDEKLKALDEARKKAASDELVANAARTGFESSGSHMVYNETSRKWEPKPKEKTPLPTENAEMSEEEWLKKAPKSVRESFLYGKEAAEREKADIVNRLTENAASDEAKKASSLVYNAMELPQLRTLDQALPVKESTQQTPAPNYFGIHGGPTTNTAKDDPNDILPLPVENYGSDEDEEEEEKEAG